MSRKHLFIHSLHVHATVLILSRKKHIQARDCRKGKAPSALHRNCLICQTCFHRVMDCKLSCYSSKLEPTEHKPNKQKSIYIIDPTEKQVFMF